jgi:hypothetical protein
MDSGSRMPGRVSASTAWLKNRRRRHFALQTAWNAARLIAIGQQSAKLAAPPYLDPPYGYRFDI